MYKELEIEIEIGSLLENKINKCFRLRSKNSVSEVQWSVIYDITELLYISYVRWANCVVASTAEKALFRLVCYFVNLLSIMVSQIELSDPAQLAEFEKETLRMITEDGRLELLLLHGLIHYKDKLWQGRITKVDFNEDFTEETKHDERGSSENSVSVLSYIDVLQEPIILPELEPGLRSDAKYPLISLRYITCFRSDEKKSVAQYFKDHYGKHTTVDTPFLTPKEPNDERIRVLGLSMNVWDGIEDIYKHNKGFYNAGSSILTYLPTGKTLGRYTVAEGYEIREMTVPQCVFAATHWKYASPRSHNYYACCSQYGLAIGAFQIGSQTPVSWVFIGANGAISALITLPEHTRKGLARAVVGTITKKVISMGLIPFAFIEDIETAYRSKGLFQSLGFELCDEVRFTFTFV